MNLYVESNFVLELALAQEQQASCEEIVRLSEEGSATLVIPAYSLVEPFETLIRRQRQRKQMKAALDVELGQITRTVPYADKLSGFQDLTALLSDSADEEVKRLKEVQGRLLKTCEVIPLDVVAITAAARYQSEHDLSPQDALVYASVISHLVRSAAAESCFLNRNTKDFEDPDIVDELRRHACSLIPRFDDGLAFARSRMKEPAPA